MLRVAACSLHLHFFGSIQIGYNVARDGQRVRVVLRQVVGDTGRATVQVGAAELLGRHHFAGGRLDQRRPAEENRAVALDNDALVGHGGHVGATSRARAHHHGNLRNAALRHVGLVEENAATAVRAGGGASHYKRTGQNAPCPETRRLGGAKRRRPSRPGRCKAGCFAAQFLARANAS